MDRETVSRIIDQLRRLGDDNYHYEIKKARGGFPESLHETVSAFANADGGTILLGVDEKASFTAVGLKEPRSTRDRFITLCRAMDPPVAAPVDLVEIDDATVLAAYIAPLPREQRPCHLAARPPWDTSFVRMADGDRKLSAYEVQLLLENRRGAHHDSALVTEATQDDLDSDRLAEFISRARAQRTPFKDRTDANVLQLLNIIREGPDGPRATLAGLLTFGIYPQQYFPQLDVTVAVFPNTSPARTGPHGERFLDSRSIDGPIPTAVRDVTAMLKRHMKRRAIISGLFRTDEWEYPEEVLRELLVNALAHRDYSPSAQGAQIQVELYPDRLEVRNPGGIFGPARVEDLGLGTAPSSARNPVLMKILEDAPLEPGRTVCENRGTGIIRMREILTEAGMEPPVLRDRIATFTATIPNHVLIDEATTTWLSTLNVVGLSSPQLTALALARRGETLTNTSYRQATGVADSRTATGHLRELRDRGLLMQDGERGQTVYRLDTTAGRQVSPPATDNAPLTRLATVRQYLTAAPVSSREIAERSGLSQEQVRQALARLRRAGEAELVSPRGSRKGLWRLAQNGLAAR
jgi:ATP-dependent DNA helicase RecG